MAQVLCPILVGRDTELECLDSALAAAIDGRGGCAMIVGEPGIGKSRLAREVASRAVDRGVQVATGRAVPSSATAAYRAVTEALLQLLRNHAIPDDAAMVPWLPALAALLPGLPAHQPAGADASPAARGEAVVQLLRRLAPEGAVIVLEDLHWADPDTVALVEYLGDHLDGERVLCVATLRTSPDSAALDAARRQRGRAGIVHLSLDRLGEVDMATMVRACVPEAGAGLLDRVCGAAEGIPLLVEELLASRGIPESFAGTVRERLAEFSEAERAVIETAAVLGRHFEWELLAPSSGQPATVVSEALGRGVDRLLMVTDGTAFRFRHALTRDAVLDTMLPPRQRALAIAVLAGLDAAHPRFDAAAREVATDVAIRAGDRPRAGLLLAESGRRSLGSGALATAVDTLRQAADLLEDDAERAATELLLVEALAHAGRVDEAAAVGGRAITRLGAPTRAGTRREVHLRLAQAGVAASRWQMARHHLDAARSIAENQQTGTVRARMAVLEADLAFADDDPDGARRLAEEALGMDSADPAVRCQALEIIGRSHRFRDLRTARDAFERALVTATSADLPLWRLRALHELGTIDLFDHAGVDRLAEARHAAEQMGAMSTAAIVDLQLSAAYACRWELDECDAHARSAADVAERLGLEQVRAKAFVMLTGSASMRADADQTERFAALTVATAPDDPMLEGFCWAGRGIVLLLQGDADRALDPYARGMAIFARLPHAEPAALRALWPLLLASIGDRRAARAIDEARRLGVDAFHLNRGLIGYAEAVLAGRAGRHQHANELVTVADTEFTNCDGWADLARLCAAPSALADVWGDPARWLRSAADGFRIRHLPGLAERCEKLLGDADPNPWAASGITSREADILRLVVDGLANKAIAGRLHLSPRTVEKHVESLLRKTGARSRTELAVTASSAARRRPG